MTTQIYTFGDDDNSNAPTIVVGVCNGNLVVNGEDGRKDSAAHSDEPLDAVRRDDGRLFIEWCGDLRLDLPGGATVIASRVEGDARIEGVASVNIAFVGGDLRLHTMAGTVAVSRVTGDATVTECGASSLQDVGGDLRVEHDMQSTEAGRVGGNVYALDLAHLTLGAVGRDAHLEKIVGMLGLVEIEGDLSLQGAVASFGPTHVGGDVSLDLAYAEGDTHHLDVEGDVVLVVAREADVTLHAMVQGDVVGVPSAHKDADGVLTCHWGRRSAHLTLRVAGDLSVRSGATHSRPPLETPVAPDAGDDALFAVLDAVARGSLSPAEADDLLSRSRD